MVSFKFTDKYNLHNLYYSYFLLNCVNLIICVYFYTHTCVSACRLSGLSPFMGDVDAETYANITRADYDFDDEAFDAISQDAKDFISSLLVKRQE